MEIHVKFPQYFLHTKYVLIGHSYPSMTFIVIQYAEEH
jgi:hypothetical protein